MKHLARRFRICFSPPSGFTSKFILQTSDLRLRLPSFCLRAGGIQEGGAPHGWTLSPLFWSLASAVTPRMSLENRQEGTNGSSPES